MEKYIFDRNNGLWYELQGDYFIPCLVLEEVDTQPIGMCGRKHLRYIKEHRPTLYTDLLTSGKLSSYLAEVDNRAKEMLDLLVKQMAGKPIAGEETVVQLIKALEEESVKYSLLFMMGMIHVQLILSAALNSDW